MKPELTLHGRSLRLQRYPVRNRETLQAWDAADEYLINQVEAMKEAKQPALTPERPIVILNDGFGALACWFAAQANVVSSGDSYIARKASEANLADNNLSAVTFTDCLAPLPENPQLVLIKLPKNNRLLIWQLAQLCAALPDDCTVIAAAKAKDIHTSTLKLFEKHLGPTSTSLAVKKARLIFCKPDKTLATAMPDIQRWDVPEYNLTLTNHANVFSGESLDIGARLLLEHIPQDPKLKTIIDLGCGNGVIGLHAARLNPEARITCVDESYMAVASCRENADLNLTNRNQLTAKVDNCLESMINEDADLVLCNPPFHQQNTITDHIAWQMFCDAKRCLRRHGRLIVIGNRHLGYDGKLKRLFAKVHPIAQNNKFVVYQAEK
ncbi:methyltransferase [Photobacterium galatheae]|uniref:Ribosomal RNA large subunit methyltransferase G n=1 Tax=Photobacterium galatheae TaxID=1654360 RepID=A0A066RR91_9GAMM|nr:methyltransferase [Photobacterium galatheae]KDM92975.1 50S rRNA methyltransferase [Photobacterium galatheae]MCM0148497.1 methyltransferase [Photobacterium galatheae]